MGNIIIIAGLIVIVAFSLRGSLKHFKGEGGCCGGGDAIKPKRKKLNGASAKVNLKKKTAVVSMDREIPDEVLKEVVEKAGYTVSER